MERIKESNHIYTITFCPDGRADGAVQEYPVLTQGTGLTAQGLSIIDRVNQKAELAIPLPLTTQANIQRSWGIAWDTLRNIRELLRDDKYDKFDRPDVIAAFSDVDAALAAGVPFDHNMHRQLREALMRTVIDIERAIMTLSKKSATIGLARDIQEIISSGLADQAKLSAENFVSFVYSGKQPSVIQEINLQNRLTCEYSVQEAIRAATMPIAGANRDNEMVKQAASMTGEIPLYLFAQLGSTEPLFTVNMAKIIYQEMIPGDERSVAIEAFRDIYTTFMGQLLDRMIETNFPDRDEQSSEQFEQLFREYVDFWFNIETTKGRTAEQAEEAAQFMENIALVRFRKDNQAGMRLIEYWQKKVISPDGKDSIANARSRSANPEVNAILRQGWAETAMELTEMISSQEFMEKDYPMAKELLLKVFESLIDYVYDLQTSGVEYHDQIKDIRKTLYTVITTVMSHTKVFAQDLTNLYQRKVKVKLDRNKRDEDMECGYVDIGTHVLNKLTLNALSTEEDIERYIGLSKGGELKDGIFRNLCDIYTHINYDGDKDLNNRVTRTLYNAVDKHLTPEMAKVSYRLIGLMRQALCKSIETDNLRGNTKAKLLNDRNKKITEAYVLSVARAIHWTFTDPLATGADRESIKKIVSDAVGLIFEIPLIATIVDRFKKTPLTPVRLKDLPKEVLQMMNTACHEQINIYINLLSGNSNTPFKRKMDELVKETLHTQATLQALLKDYDISKDEERELNQQMEKNDADRNACSTRRESYNNYPGKGIITGVKQFVGKHPPKPKGAVA